MEKCSQPEKVPFQKISHNSERAIFLHAFEVLGMSGHYGTSPPKPFHRHLSRLQAARGSFSWFSPSHGVVQESECHLHAFPFSFRCEHLSSVAMCHDSHHCKGLVLSFHTLFRPCVLLPRIIMLCRSLVVSLAVLGAHTWLTAIFHLQASKFGLPDLIEPLPPARKQPSLPNGFWPQVPQKSFQIHCISCI